jgi:protein dithiol oxidoreductase (disulfide-forming)
MFKSLLAVLAVFFGTSMAEAQPVVPSPFQAGKNYFLIDPPQPTNSGDKIEVLEVFSYGCPHCSEFQPTADKMIKQLPANAQWSYLPAQFQPSWPLFARAFFAAQALGILDKSHKAFFTAIYLEHKVPQQPKTIDELAPFFVDYGVKAEDFVATAKSFAIEAKLKRADSLQRAYGVESTPTIVVNGRYRFTGQSAGSIEQMGALLNYLVKLETVRSK